MLVIAILIIIYYFRTVPGLLRDTGRGLSYSCSTAALELGEDGGDGGGEEGGGHIGSAFVAGGDKSRGGGGDGDGECVCDGEGGGDCGSTRGGGDGTIRSFTDADCTGADDDA